MLCINNLNTDIYFNLSAEEYLFLNFSEDIFMMWQSKPSVVVGKYQDVRREVNIPYSKQENINIARRFSGGGCVFHDMGNVNFTFITQNSNTGFRYYAEQIVSGLGLVGLDANIDKYHSIWLNEHKISGSAQYLRKNRLLFHATLLFSSDLQRLNMVLQSAEKDIKSEPRYSVRSNHSPVTNIEMHLKKSMDIESFKQMFFNYIVASSENSSFYSLNNKDIESIENLSAGLYKTEEWIMAAKKENK